MTFSKFIKRFYPYVIILVGTIISAYILFYPGANVGDDVAFHYPNIYELYKDFLNGTGYTLISGQIAFGLGSGTRLFYSPIPHLTAAIVGVALSPFGINLLVAFKIVLFLTIFASGIFMYHFGLKISKGKTFIALLAALFYVVYPYRLFDVFCRVAYAEAFSFVFLPLFFMGLYQITHEEKPSFTAFLRIIIGGSCTFLCHNITALYAYVFGVIFLVFNIKGVIRLLKTRRNAWYSIASCVLLLGLAGITLFPMLELYNTGIYNVNDPVVMWTSVESVSSRAGEMLDYSGFLNITYLTTRYADITQSSLLFGILMFLLLSMVYVLLDYFTDKLNINKLARKLLLALVYVALVLYVCKRREITMASILFGVVYTVIGFVNLEEADTTHKLYKNPTLWFIVIMCGVIFFMMASKEIWKIMPQLFRNIQFPWRLWAFIQLFLSMGVALVLSYIKNLKAGYIGVSVVTSLMLVANMPSYEKRLVFESNDNSFPYSTIDENVLAWGGSIGWNREYVPTDITNWSYVSQYSNSLLIKIRYQISSFQGESYCYDPVCLDGDCSIKVNYAYAGTYKMSINASGKSLIQMPLFYYKGYQIKLVDDSGNIIKINGKNIDGLVAFELPEGSYEATVTYVGTTIRSLSLLYFDLALSGLLVFYGIDAYIRRKDQLKELSIK